MADGHRGHLWNAHRPGDWINGILITDAKLEGQNRSTGETKNPKTGGWIIRSSVDQKTRLSSLTTKIEL